MKTTTYFTLVFLTIGLAVGNFGNTLSAQDLNSNPELDEQV